MAFLWTADNPHAPLRANGKRFWGYPSRNGGLAAIRVIVIHTAETDPSPASAENVARWQRDTAAVPSSYHRLVDSDSTVVTLPDSAVAFHVANFNTPSLGLSFATRASLWGRYPVWDREALERAAKVAAEWADRYDVPLRWITRAQALGGARGFVRHSTMDPSRRSDPGASFPAARFFDLIRNQQTKDWFTMATEAELRKVVREEIERATGGRKIGDDTRRIRMALRTIAALRFGLPTQYDDVPERVDT